ncbi:MAG: PTS lactose/cellobiose transporter subunit IIA [Firmicutes bacterium]|nr:PTS lactose/cellobiose transporter subunit IIA [Bacillota bacterium]
MENEEIVFSIILHAGNARGLAYDALKSAQNGDFEEAESYLKKAEDEVGQAHKIQTSIMQKEAKGEEVKLSVLFVHSQDHLMTTISEKGLIENMIEMHKRIHALEKEKEA